ncbi:TadE/TadG family type IV pilus assembly protein [Hyphomicrobium sp. CS1GBMeth3]|uniref:TadE/TadG family type IV pilus assembly protein n=1 Tax=Hyphomicrobium sp. CS1GBMeth3 TaxID=1892845 RepID=UPI0009F9B727|nr:TadE/TadG family type IV pilus assembly protein [Hyphomicrobium sp. CS1GBMeth3]
MRSSNLYLAVVRRHVLGMGRRFQADARGATAVEFAIVAAPFFVLVLGIMTIGLQFMTSHFLEHGVEAASRKIRTGEVLKDGLTLGDFRQMFCSEAGRLISCDEHLVIHIKSSETFAGLSPLTSCVTDGQLTPAEGDDGDGLGTRTGGASQRVVVSACYQWDMGLVLWQKIWNLLSPTPTAQGRPVLSAVAAFQSEPYPE